MNIKSQILDAIDDINIITAECEYNTICEMYNSYDKASMILEYYEGDNVDAFGVFQESSVSDKMKASGKKYNTFMKIITFIPRLIKALFETIKEKFKKIKPSKELQQAPKEVKEKLTTVFDKKKDKKKRIATVASLILGAGAVGVATKVGVHKLRVRHLQHLVNRLGVAVNQFFKELEDRNMSLDDLADYIEDFKDKVEKAVECFYIAYDTDHKYEFKERKRAIRDAIVLFNELKKDVMKIEHAPKDKKEKVVKEINNLGNKLTELSDASDEDALNEAINSSMTDTSSTSVSKNNREETQEPTPEKVKEKVEKIAENIVDKVDAVLEDINKRYKALVNKLYSHDAMQLPPEDKQIVGIGVNAERDKILLLLDKSEIGHISSECMCESLTTTRQLLFYLIHTYGDDVDKIDEEINELFKNFKNEIKENYRYGGGFYGSGDKSRGRDYINHIEDVAKDSEKIANEFNQRSDKDKELLMANQSVQNAIKTLNDESKFYRDIFYEFLSLCGEMTKLIDDTYNSLKFKLKFNVLDEYKFDENAEKLSKINTDIPTSDR